MRCDKKELIERTAVEMESIAKELGLSFWPQVFRWVNKEEMAVLYARDGSPIKYLHWGYGKAYQQWLRKVEAFGELFVIYELVINSNPCIAYLVENTATDVLALVIGHVYGHNDFFRNNIVFRDSNPCYILPLRVLRYERIKELENRFGQENVERVLDAARTVMHHRSGIRQSSPMWLEFFAENPRLEDWERELILIVNDEAKEELRYLQTKTMNEGWACFWETEFIFRSSILPYDVKDGALRFHSVLTSPPDQPMLGFNPYNLGMLIWRDIANRFGEDKLFAVRSEETDVTFFERYLTQEVGAEANLAWFEFDSNYQLRKIIYANKASPDDWGKIKNSTISNLPINSIPLILYAGVEADNTLLMSHFFDGRDLELEDAKKVVSQIASCLWKGPVKLITEVNEKKTTLSANSQGEIR